MFSLNGQQSWNFFRHDWTTHLPTPLQYIRLLPPGTLKFSTVTHNIRQVGTSDWATAGEDGLEERHPRFPYRDPIQYRKAWFEFWLEQEENASRVPSACIFYYTKD